MLSFLLVIYRLCCLCVRGSVIVHSLQLANLKLDVVIKRKNTKRNLIWSLTYLSMTLLLRFKGTVSQDLFTFVNACFSRFPTSWLLYLHAKYFVTRSREMANLKKYINNTNCFAVSAYKEFFQRRSSRGAVANKCSWKILEYFLVVLLNTSW